MFWTTNIYWNNTQHTRTRNSAAHVPLHALSFTCSSELNKTALSLNANTYNIWKQIATIKPFFFYMEWCLYVTIIYTTILVTYKMDVCPFFKSRERWKHTLPLTFFFLFPFQYQVVFFPHTSPLVRKKDHCFFNFSKIECFS